MKQKKNEYKGLLSIGSAAFLIAILAGCCSTRDTIVTKEISKTGSDWSQSEVTQEYRNAQGKVVKDKQTVDQKVKCISKTGKRLSVSDADECLRKGGRIIDEVTVTEVETVR